MSPVGDRYNNTSLLPSCNKPPWLTSFNHHQMHKPLKMNKNFILTILLTLVSFIAKSQSWTQLTSGTSEHLLSIHFTDDNTGYTVGTGGTILKTVDGGLNWTPQNSGTFSAFYATCFTDALTGWAVGDDGVVRRTTDGGNTWTSVYLPSFSSYRAVWFLDANTGFITGGLSNITATIFKTTDGGNTWIDISPGTGQVLYGIFFTSPLVGHATDFDGRMLKTLDGGTTWTAQFVSPHNLHGVYFTDANTGYVAGGNVGSDTGVLLKTLDAGNTWTAYPVPQGFLTDVKFSGPNKGIAVGGSVANNLGLIMKTTDAGVTWTQEAINGGPTSRQFRAFLPSAQVAYSCGLNGTILKTPVTDPCIPALTNGLTGFFPFNGNTNDESASALNGIGYDLSPATGHDGVANSAYHFNGNSSWIDGGTDNRNISSAVSVIAWVRTTEQNRGQWVLGKYRYEEDKGFTLSIGNGLNQNIGQVLFGGRDGTSGSGPGHLSGYSTKKVNDGEWHCLTGIAADQQWEVYVDGALENSAFGSTIDMSTSLDVPFTIGFQIPASPVWMNGDIDNVRLYNRRLTDCEIKELCATPPMLIIPPPGGSTVACLGAAQVPPIPPKVNSTCADSLLVTGPIVSADPTCGGVKTYTWMYQDCNGSTGEWVYTYTITPPTFSMPAAAGSTVTCLEAALVVPVAPTVNNSCGDLLLVSGPVASADPACAGTKTYTWTYTDCTGTTAEWVYTYTITAPTFSLPAAAGSTVTCLEAALVVPTPPTINNSCGDLLLVSGPVASTNPACAGTKTYTWTYTDCTGMTAEWVYTYTVTPPTFSLPAAAGSTVTCLEAALVVPTPPAVNNSCGDLLLVSGPVASTDPACAGTKTYTWTYTDCTGITAEWVYTYTITPPSFNLPAAAGSTVTCLEAALVVPVAPTINNSCGDLLLVSSPMASANPVCAGTKIYTWTYTDCTGMTGEWVYTYTVAPPTFSLPAAAGSTVSCAGAQVVPTPPAVTNSCGDPVLASGPVVGANPNCIGTKTYTWTYTDCSGITANWVYTYTILEEPSCDEKVNNCVKFELLTITEDASHARSYRIRVTNNCANKLSYLAVQLPNSIQAKAPLNNAVITTEVGRNYTVRNPNYTPFYSIRFTSLADSIANGQSDVFEYTLPAQAPTPSYIHVLARVAPQVNYEAHLNTFGCEVDHSSNRGDTDAPSEVGFPKSDASIFYLYPNPNLGTFSLEFSQAATQGMSYRIISLTGQLLLEQSIEPGSTAQAVQASHLIPGLYFLQVMSEGRVVEAKKFVKE